MKRRILLYVFSILFVICSIGFISCGEKKVNLVGWENETSEIGYGQTYTLDLIAVDDAGNSYTLTAGVTKKDGKTVEVLNGKFVASEKGEYIITYRFKSGSDERTRTVTLRVVAAAKPIINIDGISSPVLKDMAYKIPLASAYDYFDGELSYTVKVMKKTTSGDEEVDFDKQNGVFTATETGEFYILYSSVNSNRIEGTATLDINVVMPSDLKNLAIVTEETEKVIYNKDIADQSYVAANAAELADISGDYSGNAKKFRIWTNPNYNLKCNYSADLITEMAKYYNSVTMWIAVTGITVGNAYMTTDVNMNAANTLQSLATGGQLGLKDVQDKWIKMSVSTERVAELVTTGEFIKLFYIWCNNLEGEAYVYVGDIQFEKTLDVTNKDMTRTYLTCSGWQADGITGDYTGDAIKFSGGVNSGFIYKNLYSEAELENISETNDTVNLKVAFNFTGGTLYLFDSGYEGKADSGTTAIREANGNVGVWLTWSIPIADYIALVAARDYEYFYPWGGDDGSIAWSDGINGNIAYYFGEISFTKSSEDPEPPEPIEPVESVVDENGDHLQPWIWN